MLKELTVLAVLLIFVGTEGWSDGNVFPAFGSVGIGTTSPWSLLSVESLPGPSPALSVLQSFSGSTFGLTSNAANLFQIDSDSAQADLGDPIHFLNGLEVSHIYGGSAMTGGRQSLFVTSKLSSASSGSNPTRNYVAGAFLGTATSGDGGTNTGSGALGAIFGINPFGLAQSGATNLLNVTGGEVNFALAAGSSAKYKTGLQIVEHGLDALSASSKNAALAFSAISPATGLDHIITIDDFASKQPLKTTGTIMATGGAAATVANGIDFSNSYTFTGCAYKSPGFCVTGTGTAGFGTLTPAGQMQVAKQSGIAQANFGDDAYSTSSGPSGIGVMAWNDGNDYLDFKTKSSGFTYFRTGQGAEPGYQRIWMSVNAALGTVGIGTTYAQATLDINGYMRLRANGSPPAACVSSNDNSVAVTSHHTMCICKGSSGTWVSVNDGVTSCSW